MSDPNRVPSRKSGETPSDPCGPSRPSEVAAFHSQFEHISNPQHPSFSHAAPYGQHQAYDMAPMAATLPQLAHPHQPPHTMSIPGHYGPLNIPGAMPPQVPMQPSLQHQPGRPLQFDHAAMARFQQQQQQQQYMAPPYMPHSPIGQRPPLSPQAHGQFDPNLYNYDINALPTSPFDPRYTAQPRYGINHSLSVDASPFMRRSSEPAPIPSFPRGPPRKPKQSGHALWVGNLPPAATVTDLKDHFSRDATKDIESLFLISKSNCAFVNYRSEEACIAAMHRFHDSRFHNVRLVCRLRRGTNTGGGSSGGPGPSASTPSPSDPAAANMSESAIVEAEEPTSPTIVGSTSSSTAISSTLDSAVVAKDEAEGENDKYFIVKSLTVQDLEASVRNGVWATQSHNEAALSRAYEEADNVYLVFSANKSGEYFGYARMASAISGEPVNLGSTSSALDEPLSTGAPQSIPTKATATAPKGRIIDDSARGTIFWEADHSDMEEREESPEKEGADGTGSGSSGGQNWGRQFSVEWLSTARLPFYRTRGLRNPWNANREVKIARDGTELEPSIGRRLVQIFHRPPPSPSNMPQQHPGMLYPQ